MEGFLDASASPRKCFETGMRREAGDGVARGCCSSLASPVVAAAVVGVEAAGVDSAAAVA